MVPFKPWPAQEIDVRFVTLPMHVGSVLYVYA
jgi:hypothetical protein